MSEALERFQQRSQEVGRLLHEARTRKGVTLTRCAEFISTSRRRYAAIERGEVGIEFPELELLAEFLEIPQHDFWRKVETSEDLQQITVQALPGRTMQILIVQPTIATSASD
jgi:transcriptional regulator with XRE-family HTH domain